MHCFVLCLQSTALISLSAAPLLQLSQGTTAQAIQARSQARSPDISPHCCPAYLPQLVFVPHGDRVVKDMQHFSLFPYTQGRARKIILVAFKPLTSQECLGQLTRWRKCCLGAQRKDIKDQEPASLLTCYQTNNPVIFNCFTLVESIPFFIFKCTDKIKKHLRRMQLVPISIIS